MYPPEAQHIVFATASDSCEELTNLTANQNQLKNADFSLLLHFRTSRRKENQQTSQVFFGVCSSLGTRVHFTQQFVHQSVSVQGTLAAAASFPGPLLLCERWRNVKQRPRRAPTSQGLQGCCYCSSLWLTLAATTGDK